MELDTFTHTEKLCIEFEQNDSKAEFTGRPSETESDSDSAEGTEGEDKVPASSVIYSSKSSWQPKAGCKIN